MDDDKQADQNQPDQSSPDNVVPSADKTTDQPVSSPETSDGGVINPTATGDTNEPTYSGGAMPPASAMVTSGSGKKRWLKWGVPAAVVAVLIIVAIYVFLFYLPNRPAAVYSAGLENTGKALDRLIDYSQAQQQKTYSSTKLSGTFGYKSPSVSGDASLDGVVGQNGNSKLNATLDLMGKNITVNMLTNKVPKNDAPDVYLKVGGVKDLLGTMSPELAQYSDKWLLVDHTLVDTYKRELAQGQTNGKQAQLPSYAQVNDAAVKVEAVNKQYLFTDDSTKAVLVKEKFIGQETKNGRTVYHYKVGYNKAHLKAYVKAVAQAVNSSKLNDWYKAQNSKHQDLVNMDKLNLDKQMKDMSPNYKFDLWVDKGTKLVQSLKFVDSSNSSNKLVISQNYTGGSVYPFALEITSMDNGKPITANLGFTINTDTNQYDFKAKISETGDKTSFNADIKLTPSESKVNVTVPKNAKSITDLLTSVLGSSSAL